MGKLCNTVLGMLTGYLLTAIKVCTSYMYTLRATLFPSQLKKNISPPVKQPGNKAKSHNPDKYGMTQHAAHAKNKLLFYMRLKVVSLPNLLSV